VGSQVNSPAGKEKQEGKKKRAGCFKLLYTNPDHLSWAALFDSLARVGRQGRG